jgi:protein gp37
MAENSKIEWCDHTFNPWTGCAKVSPGCDNCYAEGWSKRAGDKVGKWGAGAARVRTSAANWKLPLKWNAQAATEGRRFRVFCASLADVFDNAVDPDWRAELFGLIADTQHLDWLLLTKRIGNAAAMIREAAGAPESAPAIVLPNVWIGATVVNQEEADRDIPKLLATPAAVRFLSMEPLLGPVDFRKVPGFNRIGLDLSRWWVIVGGESGPHARPMQEAWATNLRDQCKAAGVPFLFKQWGEWSPCVPPMPDGMVRLGKKSAGRLLEGVTHDGYPT